MERLWAPWRNKFLSHPRPTGCIFCEKPRSRSDRKNLILERGRRAYSILNLYPYNNGHVMIAPYRHLKDLRLLSGDETTEIFAMAKALLDRLDKVMKPDGYNVGFNVGRAAGAGYDRHVHLHVVPRWNGDTNFMPVLSGTKVISESLDELRERLLACRS
jgi:ATP adenylyltransferase